MTSRLSLFFITLLLLLSIALRNPILFLLGALMALVAGASALWGRYCLAGVAYDRRFGSTRLVCGEETDVWVEIVNAKPLPLAWLKAEDEVPAELPLERVDLGPGSAPNRRLLTNLFSLRWYERVRRHYRLTAARRGAFDFGPVGLSSGDLFGFQNRHTKIARQHTVLVYPKIVSPEGLGLRAARPGGEHLAQRRIIADPLRLAGTRDYQPGDSVRHVHWKATARRGALQTKVFEPSASRQLILCLNNQTRQNAYEGVMDDDFETALVVAASVARAALEARHPVGLFTNGAVREAQHRLRLPASRQDTQLVHILEALAQLSYFTLMPFEALLQIEAPQLPYGSTVIAVSALVNEAILSKLLDLRAAGHPGALIVVGQTVLESPPDLPIYFVAKNWTDLEALELD